MKQSSITHHAQIRKQQRAINDIMTQLIDTFGITEYQAGGTEIGYIPRKDIHVLRKAIDSVENVMLVRNMEGTMITAFHQDKRIHVKARG